MMRAKTLEALVADWLDAKDAERKAESDRLVIETELTAMLKPDGPECTMRAEVAGYGVKVQYKVTRKVDADALSDLWETLDPRAQKAFTWKPEIRPSELRKLQQYAPDIYSGVAGAITVTPAKPYVSILLIDAVEAA